MTDRTHNDTEGDDQQLHSFFEALYSQEEAPYGAPQPQQPRLPKRWWLAAAAVLLVLTATIWWWARQGNTPEQALPLMAQQPQEVVPVAPIITPLSEWQATTDYLLTTP